MDQMTKKEAEQQRIKALYERIQLILDRLNLKWMDLAKLIGVSPKTLSSMKAQNVNPSYTTIVKIAAALDVSVDELASEDYEKREMYYEVMWLLPKILKTKAMFDNSCTFIYQLATLSTSGPDGKRDEDLALIKELGRTDYTKKKIKERLGEIEKEETEES